MIAILGCGPAGLIAAHTLREAGVEPTEIDIISTAKVESVIGGAQFLHEPIFGDSEPEGELGIVHLGDGAGYAEKVYGDAATETSWQDHEQTVVAWGLRTTYRRLWSEWSDRIQIETVDGHVVQSIREDYTAVISTIPAEATCRNVAHSFPVSKALLVPLPLKLWIDNIVVYSGRLEDRWHRVSNIFGHGWAEYKPDAAAHEWDEIPHNAIQSVKPMGSDCDCLTSSGIARAGRFGTWDRKVLLHDVVSQVKEQMAAGIIR